MKQFCSAYLRRRDCVWARRAPHGVRHNAFTRAVEASVTLPYLPQFAARTRCDVHNSYCNGSKDHSHNVHLVVLLAHCARQRQNHSLRWRRNNSISRGLRRRAHIEGCMLLAAPNQFIIKTRLEVTRCGLHL
jgi:hypothetical protein